MGGTGGAWCALYAGVGVDMDVDMDVGVDGCCTIGTGCRAVSAGSSWYAIGGVDGGVLKGVEWCIVGRR